MALESPLPYSQIVDRPSIEPHSFVGEVLNVGEKRLATVVIPTVTGEVKVIHSAVIVEGCQVRTQNGVIDIPALAQIDSEPFSFGHPSGNEKMGYKLSALWDNLSVETQVFRGPAIATIPDMGDAFNCQGLFVPYFFEVIE